MTTDPGLLAGAEDALDQIPSPEIETPEIKETQNQVPETVVDGAVLADIVPETPADYAITIADGIGDMDADLNQRLHEGGFSNAQAQLVYDLAGEILSPVLSEMDQAAVRATDRATLIAEFGGTENWKVLASKIESWGKANLPDAAFDTLCQTADGVRALHRLMKQADEASLGTGENSNVSGDIRADIARKMNDPRYWRDRDPALVAQVQADFARFSGA